MLAFTKSNTHFETRFTSRRYSSSFFFLFSFFFFTLPIIRFVGWNKSLTLRVKKRDSYLASKKKKKKRERRGKPGKILVFRGSREGENYSSKLCGKNRTETPFIFSPLFPFFLFYRSPMSSRSNIKSADRN